MFWSDAGLDDFDPFTITVPLKNTPFPINVSIFCFGFIVYKLSLISVVTM